LVAGFYSGEVRSEVGFYGTPAYKSKDKITRRDSSPFSIVQNPISHLVAIHASPDIPFSDRTENPLAGV
jgi:hypothetical protein